MEISNAKTGVIDRWLHRLVLIAMTCLLGMCAYFVWRISMVAYQIEQSVSALSRNLEEVTGTAARISKKIDRVADKVEQLEEKARDSIKVEEAEHLIDELVALREKKKDPVEVGDAAKEEIQFLLNSIRGSGSKFGYRFGHSDHERSAYNYYLRMYGKYKLYKDAIGSAEDFIERVGTKTVGGHPYYLLDGEQKRPLAEWLREQLRLWRSGEE